MDAATTNRPPPDAAPPRGRVWPNPWAEPFRLFFPAAAFAGLVGVLVWPLHFGGWVELYPGARHARLMAHGFFGAFVLGFLGTALPRLLGAPRLTAPEVVLLLGLHLALVVAHGFGSVWLGDVLCLVLIGTTAVLLAVRILKRRDVPPPGFVLVPLAGLSAAGGAVISLLEPRLEDAFFWLFLRPLLYYQGFVLLPILGVGGFILPRFFGLDSRQAFPEARMPPPGWWSRALTALAVGGLLLGSFWIEAGGHPRLGYAIRFAVTLGYLLLEVPLHRAGWRGGSLAATLRLAVVLMAAGFLGIALFPAHRVAVLHLSLVGGFGLITLTVATRVVFGHSGNAALLQTRLRWFLTAVALMTLGMATRVSGDYWPKILISHYVYGAITWAIGLLVWAWFVLPKVLVPDPEDGP